MESSNTRKRGPFVPPANDDIPDFLQDSPYFPVGLDYDQGLKEPYQKRSIRQVLKSKKVRNTFTGIVLAILILLSLRTIRRGVIKRWYSGPTCLSSRHIYPNKHYLLKDDIDWSKYAYAQYATTTEYLCNSVMIFEALDRLGSKASRVLMYPSTIDIDSINVDSQLLLKARDDYNVKLVQVELQHRKDAYCKWKLVLGVSSDRLTSKDEWADSYTKLLAFNQTQYKRLIMLDSDSTVLKHMDELFFLPATPVALPRAYWLDKPTLGSHIMLIQPSVDNFKRIKKAIKSATGTIYDMEIINDLFGDSCIVIPHRWYGLLSGEFRSRTHANFLEQNERWDPMKVIKEAKLVHFSDNPLPKPWIEAPQKMMATMKPHCTISSTGREDCRAKDIWMELYLDFKERREVCFFSFFEFTMLT